MAGPSDTKSDAGAQGIGPAVTGVRRCFNGFRHHTKIEDIARKRAETFSERDRSAHIYEVHLEKVLDTYMQAGAKFVRGC